MSKNSKLHIDMKEAESKIRTYLNGDKNTYHVLRIDGRRFSKFCKGFDKPFDKLFRDTMEQTMLALCEELPGTILSYTQSDEITVVFKRTTSQTKENYFIKSKIKLILDNFMKKNTPVAELPWNGNIQKITSLMASKATLIFNKVFFEKYQELMNEAIEKGHTGMWYDKQSAVEMFVEELDKYKTKLFKAEFDARVFSLPKDNIFDCIYWRWQDCSRNAIQMIGRSHFSHKELQGVKTNQIVNLLEEKGIKLDDFEKRYLYGTAMYRKPTLINEGLENECIRDKWTFNRDLECIDNIKKYLS